MRIVFFGTPEFAATSLEALLHEGFDVVGVVTQPDRPQGRSRTTLVSPPVKTVAERAGVPVLQPERPLGDVFLASLRRLDADVGVVVAYGHILRPQVLEVPKRGMINVHASLLPQLRGAAPIQWAIANGDERTGVSIMQMDAGLDTGPVLHRAELPVRPQETGGTLTARLADLGAATLVDALRCLAADALRGEPQDDAAASYAPKIDRRTARVVWTDEAAAIARRIRAFDPVPAGWSTLGGIEVKLFGARVVEEAAMEPGTVVEAGPRLVVATGRGAVEIAEVQPAGRRRIGAADWIRGRGVAVGRRFV